MGLLTYRHRPEGQGESLLSPRSNHSLAAGDVGQNDGCIMDGLSTGIKSSVGLAGLL
jgi:hypothetical protein